MNPWVIFPKPNPAARLRLFCLPYAGGGALTFRTWAAELPSDIELCAVQLPGRETRFGDKPFAEFFPLIEAIAEGIRPSLDKPFVLFGHSMGGLLSFELARHLRRHHAPEPMHLFVAACRAPQLPIEGISLRYLPDAELVDALGRLNATPAEALDNAELMQMILPTLRADFAVYEDYAYVPEEPLDCPITAFAGSEDGYIASDRLIGWGCQTANSFGRRTLPGDHFFIQTSTSFLLTAISQEAMTQMSRIAKGEYL